MMRTGGHLTLSLHSSDYGHGDSTINVDIGSIIVVIILLYINEQMKKIVRIVLHRTLQ